jgi:UDP-N-acetylmuramate dehydrogenase
MSRELWKPRLIRWANTGPGRGIVLCTRLDLPKTVLGRKILKRKTMNPSFSWLHKIKGEVRRDELLSAHTSMRIGGPADIFILPRDMADLATVLKYRGTTPMFVLGEGSNLLVRDRGIRGIVVSLKESFKAIQGPLFDTGDAQEETALLRVGAGVKMSFLAKYAARFGLTGIERLAGIPGSVGGALIMNAGAEGTEIGQVVESVIRITPSGEMETLRRDQLSFHYRKTVFPSEEGIIVEAALRLRKSDAAGVQAGMDAHLTRRSQKQPLTIPNSGSIFKNPPGDAAGRLIEAAGLKGAHFGQAAVSLKHGNFIVNQGRATARDVISLIEHIQKTVKDKFGVDLEREIIFVGE